MTSGSDENQLYRPFPSFAEWTVHDVSTSAFDKYASRLAQAKAQATSDQLQRVLTRTIREAAVDTNAIEGVFSTDRGFTRTVATEAAAWEAAMEAKGTRARHAFEDSLAGYELVLDAVTESHPITEAWVRDLHSTLLRSQDTYDVWTSAGLQAQPLPKGEYKKYENSPSLPGGGIHRYAPVADTAPEMHRFIEEIRTPEFQAAHPVVQAAYAHYAFVSIHPFSDGNGRVSRALASVYLYRDPGIPFVVFDDQKNEYSDALEAADEGDARPFIHFVAARATDTAALVTTELAVEARPAEESLSVLAGQIEGGKLSEDLEPAALRLRDLVVKELRARLDELSVPGELEVQVLSGSSSSVRLGSGYRPLGREGQLLVSVTTLIPHKTYLYRLVGVGLRSDDSTISDLVVIDDSGYSAEFSLADLEPIETESARQRVRVWSQRFWDIVFEEFTKKHTLSS
ncbi:MAG: Fic family protein [Scrofimicrobium sp.]